MDNNFKLEIRNAKIEIRVSLDRISPMYSCNTEAESNEHFPFLFCHFYYSQRLELFDNLKN